MDADYTPSAPSGVGTDDYRCFLMDPGITSSTFLTGVGILPDNPRVVHHAILFRLRADRVAAAREAYRARTRLGFAGIERLPLTMLPGVSFYDVLRQKLNWSGAAV